MFFIIILIKKNKSRKFSPYKVRESITTISFDKFFDYFNYAKKEIIKYLFEINDIINKSVKKNKSRLKKIYFIHKYYN